MVGCGLRQMQGKGKERDSAWVLAGLIVKNHMYCVILNSMASQTHIYKDKLVFHTNE